MYGFQVPRSELWEAVSLVLHGARALLNHIVAGHSWLKSISVTLIDCVLGQTTSPSRLYLSRLYMGSPISSFLWRDDDDA